MHMGSSGSALFIAGISFSSVGCATARNPAFEQASADIQPYSDPCSQDARGAAKDSNTGSAGNVSCSEKDSGWASFGPSSVGGKCLGGHYAVIVDQRTAMRVSVQTQGDKTVMCSKGAGIGLNETEYRFLWVTPSPLETDHLSATAAVSLDGEHWTSVPIFNARALVNKGRSETITVVELPLGLPQSQALRAHGVPLGQLYDSGVLRKASSTGDGSAIFVTIRGDGSLDIFRLDQNQNSGVPPNPNGTSELAADAGNAVDPTSGTGGESQMATPEQEFESATRRLHERLGTRSASTTEATAERKKADYSGRILQVRVVHFFNFAGTRSQVFVGLDKHPKKCFLLNSALVIAAGIGEPIPGQEGQFSLEGSSGLAVSMKCWKFEGFMSPSLLPFDCDETCECDAIEKLK